MPCADEPVSKYREQPVSKDREEPVSNNREEPVSNDRVGPGPSADGMTSAAADVRLLIPTLIAWTAAAGSLALPPGALLAALITAVLGLGVGLALAWRARGRAWQLGVSLASVGAVSALLLTAVAAEQQSRDASGLRTVAADAGVISAVGMITSDPRRVAPRAGRDAGGEKWLVTVEVRSYTHHGMRRAVAAPVLVRGGSQWKSLPWRGTVHFAGRLASLPRSDRAVAAMSPWEVTLIGAPGAIERGAESLRTGLRRSVASLPQDARGLLPGLVDGDTSQTPEDLSDAMRATGMTHLSAVSGSNVAIVLAAVAAITSAIKLPHRLRPAVGLVAVAGFVVLARPDPSVLRAAVTGSIGLLGLYGSRRHRGLPILAATVVVLLVFDPWLSRSFGFVLSVLATLGLLTLARPWADRLGAHLPQRWGWLADLVAIPAAAYVMTAPVVVLLQGEVNPIAILANALAAPLVPPATLVGVAAAVASIVSSTLAAGLAWMACAPTLGIAAIARYFADWQRLAFAWPDTLAGSLLLAALLALLVLGWPLWRSVIGRHPGPALLVAVALVGALAPTRAFVWPANHWAIVACDVGQGDGIVLASGERRAVVVDTGPDPAAMIDCLDSLNIDVVDAVVLTHFHADHIDGLRGVMSRWPVGSIVTTPIEDPPFGAQQVRTLAQRHGSHIRMVGAGESLTWGTVHATVWWPARRIAAGSVPNNASVVMSVRVSGVSAMLLGDIETEAGRALRGELLTVPGAIPQGGFDVVKVAHHGSANIDPDLMPLLAGKVALVSVGAENDYGHPNPRAMAALRRDGYRIWRTDHSGAIAVSRSGDRLLVRAERRSADEEHDR